MGPVRICLGPEGASSPLASGITGTTLYVDKGFHSMGKGIRPEDRKLIDEVPWK